MKVKGVDPYQAGIVKENIYTKAKRRKVKGRIVTVLDLKVDNRGYKLIPTPSRVVLSQGIHELITTDEEEAKPGEEVNRGGVIGFVEFIVGGVIAAGDKVVIGKREVGVIAGFDETHEPNHLNVLIKTEKRMSGLDFGIELEEEVFIAPEILSKNV